MKRLLQVLVLAIVILVSILMYNMLSAPFLQPEPLDKKLHPVSETAFTHLSEAVQFQTISHKIGMMDTAAFNGLLQFIEHSYPAIHNVTNHEVLSTHTLLYTWKGSDPKLKPQLYMGHIDVVPVERATIDQWEHPPFSGTIDDEFIWGRGTLDDKGTVIGLLEAAEILANSGFKPRHTIYFLFGQDEEILGDEGAVKAVEKFKNEGISLSFAWDEGLFIGDGMVPGIDGKVALIGTAEKGAANYELSVELEGGHASVPNKENAVGELASAITQLKENPFPYELCTPISGFMEYLGPVMPFANRLAFSNPYLMKPLIYSAYAKNGKTRAMIHTTIAPTIFKAGIKNNVIPSTAKAVVNCRILPGHTVESTREYLEKTIDNPNVQIKTMNGADPGRETDYHSEEFMKLSEVVKTVYPDCYVAPSLMLAATDSRHFEEIADYVFKFAPLVYKNEDVPRLHGINERLSKENFEKAIQIFALAIEEMDAL